MKNWDTLAPDVTKLLRKHFTPGRAGHKIDKVVVHHNGGTLSIDGVYDVWQTRQASAHYQVDKNGKIGQLVYDRDTAWHAGHKPTNQTSIGIEHANASSPTSPVTAATLENGAHLVAAICKRYGLGRPEWGKNVFPHKRFTSTDCPGHLAGSQNSAYMARAQYWYDQMTGKKSTPPLPKPAPSAKVAPKPRLVKVTASVLNVRSGPSTKHRVTQRVKAGDVFTITATDGNWGRLKSGAGWIHLGYTKAV